MKNSDIKGHLKGKSLYIDDIPNRVGTLHSVIFGSPVAKGKILNLNVQEASNSEGVIKIITYKDIPGINQIGHISHDQPLLAIDEVSFIGQPVALVVAKTKRLAKEALKKIIISVDELTPIIDPREAFGKGELIGQNKLECGSVDAAWAECDYIFEGTAESGGQEHFYFETQSALAEPMENGNIKISCSAQAPGGFQHHISDVLGIPMNRIEVDIRRLGGGFGGKEGCAGWACLAAVAAFTLNSPVKLILNRHEDITTSGKRHPFSSDFKIGFKKDLTILAYEVKLFQNGGAFADISMPVLGRTMLHTVSAYGIANFRGLGYSCRTNITPNTAFRGFGVPQAVFLIESAIYKAAYKLKINPIEIQKKNLIREGYQLPYGMKIENCTLDLCFEQLDKNCKINERIKSVDAYNKVNIATKKGIYLIPVCFGISFVQTAMNQAGSLVHIYTDGTVSISTGAVEMGQGVNSKIQGIASKALCISSSKIRVETTNTTRIANASPTSASTGADLNGMATYKACKVLYERLKDVAAKKFNAQSSDITFNNDFIFINDKNINYSWEQLVQYAYSQRIDLSCHEFYSPKQLHWDASLMKGQPYTYHSYGVSLTEVTLDSLRGTYEIDSIEIVHDIGNSLSEEIDMGQFEGGVIQGLGWSTIENLVYSSSGKCLSTTNAYKVPDIKFIPKKMDIKFLKNVGNPYAVYNSKAVGEPPFIHGIGAYFALMNAISATFKIEKEPLLSLPMTTEKAFMCMYS